MKPKVGHIFVDYEDDIYVLISRCPGGWNYIVCLRHSLKTSMWSVDNKTVKTWYKTDGTSYIRWIC